VNGRQLVILLSFLGVLFALCVFSGRAQGASPAPLSGPKWRQNSFAWDTPTTNTDGTALTDGTAINLYTATPAATNWALYLTLAWVTNSPKLYPPMGYSWWTVTAVNSMGNESAMAPYVVVTNRVAVNPANTKAQL
jgi:hypothetical protein